MIQDVPVVASAAARKYLRLQNARQVGPVCARKLVERFGTVDAVFEASIAALEQVDGVGRYRAESVYAARKDDSSERAVESAAERGLHIICWEDDEYPPLLKHTPDPPVCLYVWGRLQPEDGVAMAIVGSRRCTHYGLEQAERFAAILAQAGFTIVSGMARGADGAAHRGALSVGGRTVAVLGCGLGHIYPPEHADLARDIAAHGAVISELPINAPPEAGNFLPRNRIVVGMSLGVIVTECGKTSGALASARLATEYDREVFALPGRADNDLAYGSNSLIRDGKGKLVLNVQDVLDELGDVGAIMAKLIPEAAGASFSAPAPVDPAENAILAMLSNEETPLEHICDASGLSPASVAAGLTRLQIKGLIEQRPGNLFVRRTR